MRKAVVALAVASVWLSVLSAEELNPSFVIEPVEALMDEIVGVRVLNLPPHKKTEIILNSQGMEGRAWFLSDKDGMVDLSKDTPLEGSCYITPNPMGLFLFAKKAEAESSVPSSQLADPIISGLRAEVEGQTVAEAVLTRRWLKPQVRVSKISEPGLRATVFQPRGDGLKRAAVITLPGSEGGRNDRDAALLASRGYVALAPAYFGEEGLSKDLVNVPVEIVKKGLDFLKSLPDVDPERIGLLGVSKGAELALLAASCYREIKAVVAYVPSHVVWAGLRGFMGTNESSWTYEGEPLAFVPFVMAPEFFEMLRSDKPWRIGLLYQASLKDGAAVEKALIPVERIRGAVLLVSGKDDQLWPSPVMANKIMERLRDHDFPFPFQHLSFENAGHGIDRAFVSMQASAISGRIDAGGTVAGNAAATLESKPRMLKFLDENLKGEER